MASRCSRRHLPSEHPIQDFQWSDYNAEPGGEAADYVICPLYGAAAELVPGADIEMTVATLNAPGARHHMYFNRGTVPGQAFARQFGNSVPASFANRPVSLRVYSERIVVAAEGQIICEHRRIIERSHDGPGRTVYDWRHYLAVIQRKPGALRNGAPFTELPDAFRQLQQHLLRKPGGDREMVEILSLVLQHDEQAVLTAVEMALQAGVPTKTHILNLLHRLIDGKPLTPPVIDAPQALGLINEPKANVERYDALRHAREVRHAS